MTQDSETTIDWNTLYQLLSRPFPDAFIKYRVGSISRDQKKAQALAYVDPRAYEDRLNELVPGAWSVEFEPWGEDRIVCRLTIHGITRSSTGDGAGSPNQVAGAAAEAQAWKRACSKFGLGRHLYDLPAVWLPYDPQAKNFRTPSAPVQQRKERLGGQSASSGATKPAYLGRQRAATMQRELARLGLGRSEHLSLACRVLGREVSDFNHLSEIEARRIWNAARAGTGHERDVPR